jgi:hypothetical protein
MLGFGRSANEKAVINLFEPTFLAFGLPPAQAKQNATAIFDEVKKDMLSRSPGLDLYKTTQGTIHARDQNYMAPRLEAGLTGRDVEHFWNRPIVVVMCEIKMREMINFMAIDVAREQGQDLDAAAQRYKRTTPRYGDPTKWDPSTPFNKGLRECDADIYLEFATRVEAWRSKTFDNEVDRLVTEHGTFNAMVRHLVCKGLL